MDKKQYTALKKTKNALDPLSMDWFKGKCAGKPHISWEKIDGFRLRFSQQNQSIDPNHPIGFTHRTTVPAIPLGFCTSAAGTAANAAGGSEATRRSLEAGG